MRTLFLILLLTSQIFGTTYYISNSGDDSNMGTAEVSAWASLDKLHSEWSNINAGDKILFEKDGVWSPSNIDGRLGFIEVSNKNGTEALPIEIGAYGTGDSPLISNINFSGYGNIIRFKGSCSYVYISDLDLRGTITFNMDKTEFGATNGMHNIKLNDLDITEGRIGMDNYITTGYSGTYSNVPNSNDPYTNPFYKIEIGGCTMVDQAASSGDDWINFIFGIRYIKDGVPSTYELRDTLNLTTGAMPDTNIWIHDNIIRNSYSENLDIPGGNLHLIERNQFYGSRLLGNVFKMHSEYSMITDCIIRDNVIAGSAYDSPTGSTAFGYALEAAQRCIIESNTMSARYPALFGDNENTGQNTLYGTFKDNIIRNNNFYGAMVIYGDANTSVWGYTHNQEDSIAYINTFEGNNYWINSQYDEGQRLIKAYNNNEKSIGTDTYASNYYKGTFTDIWVNTYPTSNEHHVNPQMTDPTWTSPTSPGTYTLESGSTLINAGSATGSDHIYDVNQDSRTQGTIDVGAYEYGGVQVARTFSITPTTWNAGTIDGSDTTFVYLLITNSGNTDSTLTWSATMSDSTNFRVWNSSGTTTSETDSVLVVYDPTGEATHTDNIIFTHDGSNTSPVNVSLSGTASTVTPAVLVATFTDNIGSLTFGSELISNNDYTNSANWSSDDPIGAVVTESGANLITESSGALFTSDGTWIELMYQDLCTSGLMYKYEDIISNYVSGAIKLDHGQGAVPSDVVMNSASTFKGLFIADKNNYSTARNTGGCELTLASKSLKLVTSQYVDTVSISKTGDTDLTGTATLKNGTNFEILSGGTIFNSTTVIVRYKPTDEGSHTDSIYIATNGGDDTLALSGSWNVTTNPNFSLSKESYDFGNVDTATTVDDSVKVYNIGTSTLTGTATASGTGFSIVSGSPISISASDSAWVVYRFSPTVTGSYSGSVEFSTNATNQPTFSYTLSGVGQAVLTPPEFSINVSSYSFGTIDTSTAVIRGFIITDLGDTSLVGSMELTDSTNFEIVSGSTYDTDSTHNFYIKYSPTTVESHTCYVIFTHNASTSPDTLTLTGQGGEPYLVLSPTGSVDFGSVYTTQYADLSFTLENSGTGTLTGSLALSDSTDFSIRSGSVGNSSRIIIRFDPTTGGAKSTTFYLYHNASNYASPIEVSLFGTGAVPGVKSRIQKVSTSVFIYTPLE